MRETVAGATLEQPVGTIPQQAPEAPLPNESWSRKLAEIVKQETRDGTVVILGIGHPLKADDYVGSLVAKALKDSSATPSRIRVVDAENAPENMIRFLWSHRPRAVVIVDALDAALPPGTVVLVDIRETTDPYFATHNIPMQVVLDTVPEIRRTLLLGIQTASHEIGEPLSEEVEKARLHVVQELRQIMETVKNLDSR